ncbi:MAG: dihydropteroate synthase [Candidatus Omnitrophica bacterium]|nr:dihydropteroate synthase [Candidatus Omnitrophota bacterium]
MDECRSGRDVAAQALQSTREKGSTAVRPRGSIRHIFNIKARDFVIPAGEKTLVMGILNMTPDSFSNDGLLGKNRSSRLKPIDFALRLISDGADIIDVGGESTRPGSKRISQKEEIKRVIPLISLLARKCNVPISVDTYKTEVAKRALDSGASIVNNIMGVKANRSLLKMVKSYKAAIVLMHIRKTPKNMQENIRYRDLIGEIKESLRISIENCLETGIKLDRIIIDPGIGFGKAPEHNLEIINRLEEFKALNCPILIGTSRKSFIGKVLGKQPRERLIGTVASVCAGVLRGANIVRVHDVREIKDAVTLTDAILNQRA